MNRKKLFTWAGVILAVLIALAVGGWKWHEQPSFCSTVCHKVMTPYVQSWETGNLLARAHAKGGVACLDCHEPTLGEQIQEVKKYITRDYTTPLAKITFSSDSCLKCHGSYDELAEKTANYEYDGVQANPHAQLIDASITEEDTNPHNTGAGKHIECSQCHTMHGKSNGIVYCFTCHHAGTFKKCTECHAEK